VETSGINLLLWTVDVSNDPVDIRPLKFDQYFIWYKKIVGQ
jgi:hypothetical protein